jgi:tRNA-2-methylthio-N6-dimethylallyladenosine synthase
MSTFLVVTFGCQMNQHDSERLTEVLRGAGHVSVDRVEDAELVVHNTCSVREKAEHKLRSEVGRLAQIKRKRPDLLLAVAGCVAQQEGEALLGRMPALDLVVGPDNLAELPALVRALELGGPPTARAEFDLDAPQFLTADPTGRAKASACPGSQP